MSIDEIHPAESSPAEARALARIHAADVTPGALVSLPKPDDKWVEMSDPVLHVHAVTEEKLRPAHEAGELPPDLILRRGDKTLPVGGVHFRDYEGAGEAWKKRLASAGRKLPALEGPTRLIGDHLRDPDGNYCLTMADLGNIRNHMNYGLRKNIKIELEEELARQESSPTRSVDAITECKEALKWLERHHEYILPQVLSYLYGEHLKSDLLPLPESLEEIKAEIDSVRDQFTFESGHLAKACPNDVPAENVQRCLIKASHRACDRFVQRIEEQMRAAEDGLDDVAEDPEKEDWVIRPSSSERYRLTTADVNRIVYHVSEGATDKLISHLQKRIDDGVDAKEAKAVQEWLRGEGGDTLKIAIRQAMSDGIYAGTLGQPFIEDGQALDRLLEDLPGQLWHRFQTEPLAIASSKGTGEPSESRLRDELGYRLLEVFKDFQKEMKDQIGAIESSPRFQRMVDRMQARHEANAKTGRW